MRKFIDIVNEGYHNYPVVLRDARDIAEYIADQSSDDVDEEFIEEHFRGCSATLQLVPIDQIREGNPDANIRSKAKEKRYAKQLDPATVPPLVIEDGEIKDGNHRFRVAVAKGATELWCYVVEG